MQYKIPGAVLQYEKGSRCHTAAIRRPHGGADAAKRIGSAVSADTFEVGTTCTSETSVRFPRRDGRGNFLQVVGAHERRRTIPSSFPEASCPGACPPFMPHLFVPHLSHTHTHTTTTVALRVPRSRPTSISFPAPPPKSILLVPYFVYIHTIFLR